MTRGEPNETRRHGTTSGHTQHLLDGERPCDACRAAKAAYDKRHREAPEARRRDRANARAQGRALRELRRAHVDEYHALYEQAKREIAIEALLT
jgi:hypothetical protein